MIDENKLRTNDYGNLGQIEKIYLANVLYLKNRSTVDSDLEEEKFVEKVNSLLGLAKEKRNDDRLRFIYKRGIKHLLESCSSYVANKLHKMQDYEDALTKCYFPKNLDIKEELMDTSFASKKKLTRLFSMSPKFKQDFVKYSQTQIEQYYSKYVTTTYSAMLKQISNSFAKKDFVPADSLTNNYKRLPWRSVDVKSTIKQISALAVE